MEEIAELRAEGRKATAIWIDESIVILHFKLVRVWSFRRKRIRCEYKFDRRQRTVLLTAVDLDGNTHVDFAERANSEAFAKLLSWIIREYRDYEVVYIFLDNARYHSVLSRLPPSINFVWLPRYAPECNFVEQFHRLIKRELGFYFFTSIEEVKEVLAKFDGLRRPSLVRKARHIFLAKLAKRKDQKFSE